MSEDPNFFVCGHANFQLNVEDPKNWTRKNSMQLMMVIGASGKYQVRTCPPNKIGETGFPAAK